MFYLQLSESYNWDDNWSKMKQLNMIGKHSNANGIKTDHQQQITLNSDYKISWNDQNDILIL
jgi:hypothetical protein